MESTSFKQENVNGDGEEDIVDLCRKLDTKLEEKAKMHNLNALNVKSILHRLIKDPHVLSTLMGIEGDTGDIPSVKVTRSKVKHVAETPKVELKPVPPPRTFLDVQFENEDDDEDYRPEDVISEESDDEEEGTEVHATTESSQVHEKFTATSFDQPSCVVDGLIDEEIRGTEVSPYQLRSRVPHIDENYSYSSLNTSFTQENFDTFVDYNGQEMLTFVENPDYLSFLQGIHSSAPTHENENAPVDDDDPDDEEYNVLTELEGLKEIEKDKDELRMDRFTEIPMREVEGLFLDLIGEDVEAIRPELILQKIPTPKKKRSKRRSEEVRRSKRSKNDPKSLPVDDPPPDGSYSSSLISGEPIKFKYEELCQLRIQLEQHVQLLTQSVVMCYHDVRLTHVKNQYQLMINELDSRYYAIGDSSVFNISNLGAAIESCHDIMGISPVAETHVKWEPTPFGWSPRPEAALVLGRSRAIMYPDLLPGVQPDLFEFPHQFFTPGEDLLLAHALIQFRHVPHSNSQDPFGRLYWVQRMFLPCKTISQIRSHLRVARQHTEGQVNQRNPMYQIIIQALRGVCHLRFPFEQPIVRYETLQMWPEEARPFWYNKFLKKFTTLGPTTIVPSVVAKNHIPAISTLEIALSTISNAVCTMTLPKQSNAAIPSCTVSYEVDVSFHHEGQHLTAGVDARPFSFCHESVCASFHSINAEKTKRELEFVPPITSISMSNVSISEAVSFKNESSILERSAVDHDLLAEQFSSESLHQHSLDFPSTSSFDQFNARSVELGPDVVPLLQGNKVEDAHFTIEKSQSSFYHQNAEFSSLPTLQHEESQLQKSEFCVKEDLEEGEIISRENSRDPIEAKELLCGLRRSSHNRTKTGRSCEESRRKCVTFETRLSDERIKTRRDYDKTTQHHSSSRADEGSPKRITGRRKPNGDTYIREADGRRRSKRPSLSPDLEPSRRLCKKTRNMENIQIRGEVPGTSKDCVTLCGTLKENNSLARVGEGVGNYKNEKRLCHNERTHRSNRTKESLTNSVAETKQISAQDVEISEVFCNINEAFNAINQSESACKLLNKNANNFFALKRDVIANTKMQNTKESEVTYDDRSQSNGGNNDDLEVWDIGSPLKTWKNASYTNEEYDNDTLLLQSDIGADLALRDCESPYIPKTPTFNTPSDYSPVESIYHLSTPRSLSPESNLEMPVTPRDDMLTRSPTLLRAPPAVSKALFSKIKLKRRSIDNLDGKQTSLKCWKQTWDCVGGSAHSNNTLDATTSAALDDGDQINDEFEDVPGSEIYSAGDELDVGSKTRMKRRTRTEKERMGLERMQNPHYRARQMTSLARKIAVDIKQRTFMHQDVWKTVERIVLGKDSMETQFDRLKAALLPKHADVLVLLSLLADESVLPPELLTSPLRRAYHGAVQMLLAIEAYCHGTRSRSSNTRSLLKTIGSMGQTLGELEFCDRLADLLGNERPLWNYIRQWLPLTYDEKVGSADFEFVDLCSRTDSEIVENGGAECIDDLNAVLGAPPPRKGGSLQVNAGQLNFLQNGVYVPVLVSKAEVRDGHLEDVGKECTEPTWTKEVDMLILKTYNDIDGSNDEVVSELAQKIPYSKENIERRLNFLVSLF